MTSSRDVLTLSCGTRRCRNTFTFPRGMNRERAEELAAGQGWGRGEGVRCAEFFCGEHAPAPR